MSDEQKCPACGAAYKYGCYAGDGPRWPNGKRMSLVDSLREKPPFDDHHWDCESWQADGGEFEQSDLCRVRQRDALLAECAALLRHLGGNPAYELADKIERIKPPSATPTEPNDE